MEVGNVPSQLPGILFEDISRKTKSSIDAKMLLASDLNADYFIDLVIWTERS